MMGAALENSVALFFLKGNRKNMSTRGKKGWILAFSLPCLVLFCLVYAIPFVMVITTSFCDYSLTQSPVFEGLKNFKTIFADPDFSVSIVNTLKWVLIQSTLHVGFGFVMALILRRKPKGWKFARVWADVGCFAECKDNKYCICSVTGPDEYNAIVDNNFYTNLMARENIRSAMWALDRMKSLDEDAYNKLVEKLELEDEELEYWERIINNMYFPFDEKLQIYPQDDGFMMRKPWDESKIPEEKRHLLYENYHPLFVYRQKMSKQADAILGMLLHSNFFTEEELKRNYDFYQTVTLHHSSLSTCIFGILASQIGYDEEAYKYFSQSARMDLDDMHDNFYAGIHAANMAGTWQGIVFGFAGVRSNTGELTIHPKLPEQWKSYEFCVEYHGSDMRIKIEQGKVTYKLLNQVPITFKSNHEPITLNKEGEEYVQEI